MPAWITVNVVLSFLDPPHHHRVLFRSVIIAMVLLNKKDGIHYVIEEGDTVHIQGEVAGNFCPAILTNYSINLDTSTITHHEKEELAEMLDYLPAEVMTVHEEEDRDNDEEDDGDKTAENIFLYLLHGAARRRPILFLAASVVVGLYNWD